VTTTRICPGYYGKLPQRGDFIRHGLSNDFVTAWDDWLSNGLRHVREKLGDNWLSHYLHTPVWRYYIGRNVIDAKVHTGIWFPSMDKVGRYFPFTIDCALNHSLPNWFGNADHEGYLAQLEKIGLITLDEACEIEDMEEALDSSCWPLEPEHAAKKQGLKYWQGPKQLSSVNLCKHLIDEYESKQGQFSYWWCDTDEEHAQFLFCHGMPSHSDFAQFMRLAANIRQ